ncbi:N-acetyltransferase [Thermococcus sp. 18S1]|uniref:GNAT family N-acetyltransferase n=1 Tax=Thermococcus sp. 18S1 TaxID=1638210 RepID=UPI00143C3560|nr:N-acetyltransferase [Thermococcus sp. 18S1]NJE31346.1 N-acetyltransferase [Thermococcus sp. 18S1]
MAHIALKAGGGEETEAEHFARLMEISAPEYFPALLGERFKELFRRLFLEKANLFSHEHVVFAIYEGQIAGMLLGYDWRAKKREEKRTGWLMMKSLGFDFLRKLPGFISSTSGSGRLEKGDYYVSNVAVYPEFRGRKIGKALMLEAERLAMESGAERIALDVEVDNERAIAIYKKLGYSVEREHSIELEGRAYRFYRMVKNLKVEKENKCGLTSGFSSR